MPNYCSCVSCARGPVHRMKLLPHEAHLFECMCDVDIALEVREQGPVIIFWHFPYDEHKYREALIDNTMLDHTMNGTACTRHAATVIRRALFQSQTEPPANDAVPEQSISQILLAAGFIAADQQTTL